MQNVRIALSGKRRSGKSTTTERLIELAKGYGFRPTTLSHSTYIKLIATKAFGIDPHDREGLQKVGYDWGMKGAQKIFGYSASACWTRWVLQDMGAAEACGFNFVVVDDLRFTCQAELLHQAGFILVRLETTPELIDSRDQAGKSAGNDNHPSETDLDDYPNWDVRLLPNVSIESIVEVIWITLKKRNLVP